MYCCWWREAYYLSHPFPLIMYTNILISCQCCPSTCSSILPHHFALNNKQMKVISSSPEILKGRQNQWWWYLIIGESNVWRGGQWWWYLYISYFYIIIILSYHPTSQHPIYPSCLFSHTFFSVATVGRVQISTNNQPSSIIYFIGLGTAVFIVICYLVHIVADVYSGAGKMGWANHQPTWCKHIMVTNMMNTLNQCKCSRIACESRKWER